VLDDLLHPEFQLMTKVAHRASFLYPREGVKLDEYKKIVKGYLDGFPELKITIKSMMSDEELVLVHWSAVMTHKGPFFGLQPTGKNVDLHAFHSFKLKNGLIIDLDFIFDSLSLFMELGHAVINTNEKERMDEYFKVLREMGILPKD
jgi:predicted ester cyclase